MEIILFKKRSDKKVLQTGGAMKENSTNSLKL
jgi:hypothetical protein